MSPKKKEKLTFIEEARRKQIIEATIQTIAEFGFINASLSEIADQINVSKGVISYHFDGKDDLISETFRYIINLQESFRRERVEQQNEPLDKIKTHILSNIEFFKTYPVEVRAQMELISSFNSLTAKREFERSVYGPPAEYLQGILAEGQKNNTIKDFDNKTMANLIIASLEGIMFQWIFNSDLINLDECAAELIKLVESYIKK